MHGAILHVGANTTCLGWPGPIRKNRSYEFIPIPESDSEGCRHICPTYGELGLASWVPSGMSEAPVHTDPDFDTFTYGDYLKTDPNPPEKPKDNTRMAAARQLGAGDYLFFIASLANHDIPERPFQGYYVIGYFELLRVEQTIRIMEEPSLFELFKNNAHLRKGYYNRDYDERRCCTLFKGNAPPNSRKLPRAVPFSEGSQPNDLASRVIPNPNPRDPWWWSRALLREESVRLMHSGILNAQKGS